MFKFLIKFFESPMASSSGGSSRSASTGRGFARNAAGRAQRAAASRRR